VVLASGSLRTPTPSRTYLDHAATTPMLAAAVDAMLPWLRDGFGNPSGVHATARAARAAIDEARDQMAVHLGGVGREIVFTGGGTEALNLAITGVIEHWSTVDGGSNVVPAVLTSAIEHDAVRNCAAWLASHRRVRHIEVPVLPSGVLDLDALAELLIRHAPVAVVAVMAVNNEVGTVQPIAEVTAKTRDLAGRAVVVVDAVQAAAWTDVASMTVGVDLVAVTGHKLGGPQGVGALLVREGTGISPIIHGGGQERDRRSGTQNVAGIAGLAAAFNASTVDLDARRERVGVLRDRLIDGLLGLIDGVYESGDRAKKVPSNAHLCIDGIESEELLLLLDRAGIAASAGSACASGALHVSPVLLAMGVSPERANGALRLSLGHSSTAADVSHALEVIPASIARLRGGTVPAAMPAAMPNSVSGPVSV
jgi:cysteine desulfurase